MIRRREFFELSAKTAAFSLGGFLPSGFAQSESVSLPHRLNDQRLSPIDLRAPLRLAVKHVYNAVDRTKACRPFLRFMLSEKPAYALHGNWSSPHMVGRFLNLLAASAPILNEPADEEVVNGLSKLLFNTLDNPTGLAFNTMPDDSGRRNANMHNCREVLLALTGLMEWRKSEQAKAAAARYVRTLDAATRETGTFPHRLVLENEGKRTEKDGRYDNIPPRTSGRLIGALIRYYQVSGDETAMDIAVRLADHNLAHAFTPEGNLTANAGTHLHSVEGTVTSIIRIGVIRGEAKYTEIGRLIYDVGLAPWRTSFGWAKEQRNDHPGRGEANNTGDYIEAALLLGQLGHREYYAEAERFIRNGLLASQIVNTDWIEERDLPDTEMKTYRAVRERVKGGFAFTTPNSYDTFNTDLVGGAGNSLCAAWHASVTSDRNAVSVNLLFNRTTPELTMRSQLPKEGAIDLDIHQPRDVFVRLPDTTEAKEVRLRIDGEPAVFSQSGRYLGLEGMKAGAKVEIRFDQTEKRVSEKAPGYAQPFQVDWRGETVTNIEPQGKTARLY